MGNAYWAGAIPGLLMATALSLFALRLLGQERMRHILWLVPALHFGGALLAGPALTMAYGGLVVPEVGSAAPAAWILGLLGAGLVLGWLAWRAGGQARLWRAGAWAVPAALAAVLVPPFYYLIVG